MRIPGTMLAMAARLGQMFLIVVIASAGARWRPAAEAVEWRGASQNEQDTRALDPNKPIERELAGGQVHAYRITLAAGQYLRVVVDQRGIDVVVALFGPDGKKLAEIDSPNGAKGPEHLSVVAKVPGDHRLDVRSLEKSAAAGRYEAKITALRDATQEDKAEDFAGRLAEAKTEAERTALLAAEKELATEKLVQALNKLGHGIRMQGKYEQALTLFRVAQNIAEQIGDKAGIARALNNIGLVHYSQGNYAQALEHHQKSLMLSEDLGNKAGIARALNNIGNVHYLQGNYAQALEHYQKSLTRSEALGDKAVITTTLGNIGLVHRSQGNYAQALEHHQKSLTLSEALGDKAGIASTLNNIGNIHYLQGNYAQALEHYQKSLTLSEVLGNKAGIATTLGDIGNIHYSQGNYAQALEHHQKSLTLKEALGDKAGIARSLTSIGAIHTSQGNYAQALEYHQKRLTLSEALGDKAGIASTLNNIGNIHYLQGNYAQALERYQKSLTLSEALGAKAGIANVLNNIGSVHNSQGNYAQALGHYQMSLTLSEALGNKEGTARALGNIGNIHRSQGNYAQALEYHQKSLTLSEALGDKYGIATTLGNIGSVHRSQGNYAQALEHYQKSLTLSEAFGNKAGIARALTGIGNVHYSQGNYAQALEHYQMSLTLSDALGDKEGTASTLGNIGEMYRLQGKYTQTLEFTQRAISVARSIGAREPLQHSLTTAGRAYQHLNRPDGARQALEEAITIVESLRSQVSGQESRASYFASKQEVYEFYIDLLMRTRRLRPDEGNEAIAFQTSERARARSLLELLTEARVDIRQGVDPALLEQERSLQHQLNARAERQTRLLSGEHTEEQATAIKKEIDAITNDFRQVQAQIRRTSPRYAALTQPTPLSLKEIQQQALDDDTLLLEYSLGEDRSYLWAVTLSSITSYELPRRSEIEAAARRAYNLLLVSHKRVNKRQAELAAADLSRLLLGPVAGQLGSKRLLIVSDGALQYIPFGALPKPQSAIRDPQSPAPLIADHEIAYLPSASTLVVLRRELAGRCPASKMVVVLADPVLTPDDLRVKSAKAGASQNEGKVAPLSDEQRGAADNLVRSAREVGALSLERLKFSRKEADAIARLGQAEKSFKALDFEASRATATDPEMAQYRIAHFATHGLFNSQHPELSGIVLSLVDERGQTQDGFLRLHDIYNLDLNADLVVLSACRTALGKDIKGEGLIGLTRGFMYAGAPRVVASLWNVKDRATTELMKRFYRGMMKDGLRPAAALRAAQLSMWKEKRWEAPYYWAGFVLQGEWK